MLHLNVCWLDCMGNIICGLYFCTKRFQLCHLLQMKWAQIFKDIAVEITCQSFSNALIAGWMSVTCTLSTTIETKDHSNLWALLAPLRKLVKGCQWGLQISIFFFQFECSFKTCVWPEYCLLILIQFSVHYFWAHVAIAELKLVSAQSMSTL